MTLDITLSLIIRILLAFIFLCAAWHKAADTQRFSAQLRAYHLLPERCLPVLAGSLILVEVYLACTLPLPGWRASALIAAALLSLYALAMGINLARGRRHLDCGCGGPAGYSQAISWTLVARNGILALLALLTALPVATRVWLPLDVGTVFLASIAACLLYCSIELAIVNRQRARRYFKQRTAQTTNHTAIHTITPTTSHTTIHKGRPRVTPL